ncbi:MAG: diguanylate cyclase [Gemmatimonadales bacterium]|nr:MAG: diguanylate cyclase [Gemmatimonadales bacterium]
MSKRPIRVLLVEPDQESAREISGVLESAHGDFETVHAGELAVGLEHITRGGVDVVMLNLDLPDSQGLVTFERTFAFSPGVPIVVLTSQEDDEMALASVQGGAQDYLVRKDVTEGLLVRSLRYAIERHRLLTALRSLSLIDDLTGLYNRRGFGDLGEHYLKLARRSGKGVALIYLDVDRFKTINDTLGHHVGDRALLRLAEILRACFRSSDLMARLGGDAFAVLAPEAAAEPLEVFVRRVKRAVDGFNRNSRDPYRLSVSIGATRYDGSAVVRLDDLLARADSAMYEEKRAKRKAVLP